MTGKQLLDMIQAEIHEDPGFLKANVVVWLDEDGATDDLAAQDGEIQRLLFDGGDRYLLEVKFSEVR